MSTPSQENTIPEQKPNDKELNFRQLEQKHQRQQEQIQRQLEQERAARIEAEKRAQEALRSHDDDESDSEPYVDHKRLEKKLAKFGEQSYKQTQTEIQKAVHTALAEERKANWIKQNPDFYDTLQHAEKLAQKDPDLAESILEMPESFERQKLVYKNIKALGLHKPPEKESTVQQKIDSNRRSPYYQPSGVGTAPYTAQGDFSDSGQKQAYDKMMALKKTMRLG